MIIYLGNSNVAVEGVMEGQESVTVIEPPADTIPIETLKIIDILLSTHFSEQPSWVSSDSDGMVTLLTANYGCPSKTFEDAQAAYEDVHVPATDPADSDADTHTAEVVTTPANES